MKEVVRKWMQLFVAFTATRVTLSWSKPLLFSGGRDTKDGLGDYWPHDSSEAKPLGMRNLNPFAFHYQTVALLPPLEPKRSQNQNRIICCPKGFILR